MSETEKADWGREPDEIIASLKRGERISASDAIVYAQWAIMDYVKGHPRDARIAELEAALRPFAEAYEQFAKNEHCTRVLSLGQLGRLAAGELSGAHFKTASAALSTKEDGK